MLNNRGGAQEVVCSRGFDERMLRLVGQVSIVGLAYSYITPSRESSVGCVNWKVQCLLVGLAKGGIEFRIQKQGVRSGVHHAGYYKGLPKSVGLAHASGFGEDSMKRA